MPLGLGNFSHIRFLLTSIVETLPRNNFSTDNYLVTNQSLSKRNVWPPKVEDVPLTYSSIYSSLETRGGLFWIIFSLSLVVLSPFLVSIFKVPSEAS